jgi:cyclopropane fatty-acyl-phospholipid synthase-like methyltransferase
VRWLAEKGRLRGRVLDFGCGRGGDAHAFQTEAWDPHWRPFPEPAGPYDTICCVYVLNVVSEETQAAILTELGELLADDGTVYVAVRRDLPKEGQQGRGVCQRYVVLDAPVVHKTKGFAIYGVVKSMALESAAPNRS